MAEQKYIVGVPMYLGKMVSTNQDDKPYLVQDVKTWKSIGKMLILGTVDENGVITPAFGVEEGTHDKLQQEVRG
jgi:hypothetical protein